MLRLRLSLLLSMALVAPAVRAADTDANVAASDPRIVYEGRFDTQNPAAVGVIWEASRIRIDFEGDQIGLRFGPVQGQVFFNAEIDGKTSIIALREVEPAKPLELSGLGSGHHRLVLFKRSEASAGSVGFLGCTLATESRLLPATVPHYATRMLFLGDSITVGACNEDGPADQWEDRRTHNAALSYAQMTADAFNADCRNISVSGIGVAIGWYDQLVGDVWNRIYPRASSAKADLTKWTPDTIFFNYGENDDSFSTAHHLAFPTEKYVENYAALVHAVREAFPKAEIVILRGGMFGGARSEPLRKAWEAAVARIEASDPHVRHFVFQHWSRTHPRVPDDRAMADELIAWLKG